MEKYIIAQFFISCENLDTFKSLVNDLVKKTREEEGNIFYTAYQSTENPSDFIFYEEYKDDSSFEFHLNTEHYKKFAQALGGLQLKEPVVRIIN